MVSLGRKTNNYRLNTIAYIYLTVTDLLELPDASVNKVAIYKVAHNSTIYILFSTHLQDGVLLSSINCWSFYLNTRVRCERFVGANLTQRNEYKPRDTVSIIITFYHGSPSECKIIEATELEI